MTGTPASNSYLGISSDQLAIGPIRDSLPHHLCLVPDSLPCHFVSQSLWKGFSRHGIWLPGALGLGANWEVRDRAARRHQQPRMTTALQWETQAMWEPRGGPNLSCSRGGGTAQVGHVRVSSVVAEDFTNWGTSELSLKG